MILYHGKIIHLVDKLSRIMNPSEWIQSPWRSEGPLRSKSNPKITIWLVVITSVYFLMLIMLNQHYQQADWSIFVLHFEAFSVTWKSEKLVYGKFRSKFVFFGSKIRNWKVVTWGSFHGMNQQISSTWINSPSGWLSL